MAEWRVGVNSTMNLLTALEMNLSPHRSGNQNVPLFYCLRVISNWFLAVSYLLIAKAMMSIGSHSYLTDSGYSWSIHMPACRRSQDPPSSSLISIVVFTTICENAKVSQTARVGSSRQYCVVCSTTLAIVAVRILNFAKTSTVYEIA